MSSNSENMSTTQDTADHVDIYQKVETLQRRLDAQSNQLEGLRDELADEREDKQELREELAEVKEENADQDERLKEVEATTDMLRLVEEADDTSPEQRRVAMLQHLERKAKKKGERGDEAALSRPKAALTHELAEEILHYPDIHRTTLYNDMEEAAKMVGDERVCWYEGQPEAKLVVNLEHGGLPSHIAGRSVNVG